MRQHSEQTRTMWDVSTSDDLPRSTGQGAEAELQRSTPAPSRSTKASRRLTTVPLCSPRAFATLHVTAANGADQRVVTRSTVSTQWTLFTWSAAQRHGSSMITSIACGRLARPFDTRILLELRIAHGCGHQECCPLRRPGLRHHKRHPLLTSRRPMIHAIYAGRRPGRFPSLASASEATRCCFFDNIMKTILTAKRARAASARLCGFGCRAEKTSLCPSQLASRLLLWTLVRTVNRGPSRD